MPSAGCGASDVGALEQEKRTLPSSERYYLLTTPTAHDGTTPLPLVVDFHGLAEGAETHATNSQFSALAEREGFVVVFPHGTVDVPRWDLTAHRKGNPDLIYVDQVLDAVEAQVCIDTSRVYATGLSMGAMMSSTVACTMQNRFAAVAPVSGLLPPAENCHSERDVPVLAYHGTSDPILLFNGGVSDHLANILAGTSEGLPELPEPKLNGPGYPANAVAWARRNDCRKPTHDQLTPTAVARTWNCAVGADVIFIILDGHGHGWPGSEFSNSLPEIMGPNDMSLDATAHSWEFFQRFALPSS